MWVLKLPHLFHCAPPPSFLHPSSSSPSPSSFLYLLLPRKQGHASFSAEEAALKEQQFQTPRFSLISNTEEGVLLEDELIGCFIQMCRLENVTFATHCGKVQLIYKGKLRKLGKTKPSESTNEGEPGLGRCLFASST